MGTSHLKTRGENKKTVFPEKICRETGCLFSNGEGLAAFRKSGLPGANTSKALYLQCLESFQAPFSASRCGKCFSPHFPQTENGHACADASAGRRRFDSR